MNELSLEEYRRIQQEKEMEKEMELTLLKMELRMKNLLWYFSGVLSALVAVYAISISMF